MQSARVFRFEQAEALERWLGIDGAFLSASFVGASRNGSAVDVEFRVVIEPRDDAGDDDGGSWLAPYHEVVPATDDLALPLWLVPAYDCSQRVTLRVADGDFVEDVSGFVSSEDLAAMPDDGWLVDEWTVSAREDGMHASFELRENGTPTLQLTSRGAIEVIVSPPLVERSKLATDQDVVSFTFDAPLSAPIAAHGITSHRAPDETENKFTYVLSRTTASPEAFVELLRHLGESPSLRHVTSGEVTFDRATWPDYVTPHRRPYAH